MEILRKILEFINSLLKEPAVEPPAEPPPIPLPKPEPEPIVEEKPVSGEEQKVKFSCSPKNGVYLIDEKKPCECGKGEIVGKGWVSRAWPDASMRSYRYITRLKDDKKGYVKWTPYILEDGKYEVWVRWFATGNRTSKAHYVIKAADGMHKASIDQRKKPYMQSPMQWKKLGEYEFVKGDYAYVMIMNTAGHSEAADSIGIRRMKND